jgi:hypothetical protein
MRIFSRPLVTYLSVCTNMAVSCILVSFGNPPSATIRYEETLFKVRGLLCSTCNSGLGFLKDDPEVLRGALAYLRRHSR